MKHNKDYPKTSYDIGILLSALYSLFIVMIPDVMIAIFTMVFLVIYIYFMRIAKSKFHSGEYSAKKVNIINIGGLFLFFLISTLACLIRLDGLIT